MLCVPEAEPLVARWREQGDPSAALGVPAHVTLLYPFLPADRVDAGVLAELGWFFLGVERFPLRFERTARFPDSRVVFLEPAGQDLADLLAALARRWPECPPYGGAYEQVRAHLTVVQTDDVGLRDAAEAAVRRGLPLQATAAHAELWSEGDDGCWSCTARFPFAGG